MGNVALMFSGQGAQYQGMGKDLYDTYEVYRDIVNISEHLTAYPIKNITYKNDERLHDTKYTQVCMFTMYAGILEILKEKNIKVNASMGLSLGEYGAYLHQGVFDIETGIKIVKERAYLMSQASQKHPGSMCAVIGMDVDDLESIINQVSQHVTIANYNTPKQLVISGQTKAVHQVSQKIKDIYNKRAIMLKTSGAFHSKLMSEAKQAFLSFIENQDIHPPKGHLWLNTSGGLYQNQIIDHMANQLTNSVKFYQMVEDMIHHGIDTFIEIGPKKTLSSMVKKINANVTVLNIEDIQSLEKTQTYLEEKHENI